MREEVRGGGGREGGIKREGVREVEREGGHINTVSNSSKRTVQ